MVLYSLVAPWLRLLIQCRRLGFDPWVGKIPWRRKWLACRILACRILWTEEPGRLQSKGHKESDTIEHIVYESKIYPILLLS